MGLHVFGQMGMMLAMCWKCGKDIDFEGSPARGDECPECGADLRSCKNCLRYSPGVYHDCAERAEDAPSDKERGNFCDLFSLKRRFDGKDSSTWLSSGQARQDAARAAFDSLFS